MLRIIILCLITGWTLVLSTTSLASDPGYVISLQFENDFFGGGTDRHFTHGTRIECLTKPIKWISDGANRLPWFSSERAEACPDEALKGRASISIGQNIYTPTDTLSTQLVPDDRPYAGWLYMGFGLVANQGSRRYDKVQLEVGIVGPSSMAEWVQTFWHSVLGIHVPEGWENQLANEPGAVLYYEQARRFDKREDIIGLDLDLDIIPHLGGALGNVFTYASGGFIVRLISALPGSVPACREAVISVTKRGSTGIFLQVLKGEESSAIYSLTAIPLPTATRWKRIYLWETYRRG